MGEPAHVLPFSKGAKPKRPAPGPSVRQQVEALNRRGLYVCETADGDVLLLRAPREDVRLGGACNETVYESASAVYGMQRDRDYASDCHVGGALDAVLGRAQEQMARTRAVLEDLVGRGLRLKVVDGVLWVGPRQLVDEEAARRVREHRDALVVYLGGDS